MNSRISILFLMTVALAGCGTVGTWPFYGSGPAPMKGQITADTYTSQDHSFSVALPYPATSARGEERRVKERLKPHDYYVSFGYGPPNLAFYRVELATRAQPGSMQPPFDELTAKVIAKARKEIEHGYGTKTTLITRKKTEVDGHAAYYWKLDQTVPASYLGTRHPETVEHDIYSINFRYAVAMVWVQRNADAINTDAGMSPEEFASSLKLLPPGVPKGFTRMSNGSYRFDSLPVEVRSPAELCGLKLSYPYGGPIGNKGGMNIDFVAPDYLWQISGDYYVFALHIPPKVKDKKSFISYVKKADETFIPDNSRPMGLVFKQTGFKETTVNGLPAAQAMGVDTDKAVLVTTAVLHRSVLSVASLIYPMAAGADPMKAMPWDCYDKFLSSVTEVDATPVQADKKR